MLIITSTLIDKEKQALQKRGVQLERDEETNRLWETQPSHTTRHVIANADPQKVTVTIEERGEAGERD